MRTSLIATLVGSLSVLSIAGGPAGQSDEETTASARAVDATHDVVLVGNSAAGTVSFLDGHSFANLGSVNVIPDLKDRLAAINADLIHAIAYGIVTDHQKIKH